MSVHCLLPVSQRRICTTPRVGTCLHDGKGLDSASVGDMGSTAQIDQGSATVDGGGGTIGDLGLDQVNLVLVVL